MTFPFMPLPRATTTICSTNVLLSNIPSRNILRFNCHHWCTSSDHNYYLLYKCSTKQHSFTQHSALQLPSLVRSSELARLYQVHSFQLSLMKTPASLLLGKPPENKGQIIMPQINFWLRITLAMLSTPHQRCWHHIRDALLLLEDLKELTPLLALLLTTYRDAFLTTSVLLLSPLSTRLPLFRLHYLLILIKPTWNSEQTNVALFITCSDALLTTFAPLPRPIPLPRPCPSATSNLNLTLWTKWLLSLLPAITYVTTPSSVSASSSALLWAHDSKAHDSRKQLFCHCSNPLGYISRPISARAFSIDPAPASTTSPALQVFTSPLSAACCTVVPFPVVKTLFPEVFCPEVEIPLSKAPSVSLLHFGCRHLHRNIFVAVFITSLGYSVLFMRAWAATWYHSSLHLHGAVPCSCVPGSAVLDHPKILGMDALVARLLLGGASPCSIELALETWCYPSKYYLHSSLSSC